MDGQTGNQLGSCCRPGRKPLEDPAFTNHRLLKSARNCDLEETWGGRMGAEYQREAEKDRGRRGEAGRERRPNQTTNRGDSVRVTVPTVVA